jgi:DNA-binding transcriptional LysR family regulator
LGVRPFNRTTRSVALTAAGERLYGEIKPIIEGLDHAIESVNLFRDKPIGTLRLAVSRPAAILQLAPLISPFLAEYPAIRLDVVVDDTDSDIVVGRFDAGIRVGRRIEQDMTILRLSDDPKMVVVASPSYLASRSRPGVPKDLHRHNCVRLRWPWDGTIQPWIFRKGRQRSEVKVEGSLTVNDLDLLLSAVLDGIGIAFMAEPVVNRHVADGQLVELLADWSSTIPGMFLYYPSRRHQPTPLQVFVDFVKEHRARSDLFRR